MFRKFPDIEGFSSVLKHSKRNAEKTPSGLYYAAKVKIHGTNAGVIITPDGQVLAQSRTRLLTIESDNYGFAFYVKSHEDYFKSLALKGRTTIIYGEWYGPGIQKGVASSAVSGKHFAVFAIQIEHDDPSHAMYQDGPIFIADPDVITRILLGVGGELPTNYDTLPLEIIPYIDFGGETNILVNMFDVESVNKFVEMINKKTYEVEDEDPYIKAVHGVSGIGEGIVVFPFLMQERSFMSGLMFKSKGEKHGNVVKTGKPPTTIDPVKVENQSKYVEMFVTEPRLVQIAERDVSNAFTLENTGTFLKAMMQDCLKESIDNLVESGLEWRDVQGPIARASREWWIVQCKTREAS